MLIRGTRAMITHCIRPIVFFSLLPFLIVLVLSFSRLFNPFSAKRVVASMVDRCWVYINQLIKEPVRRQRMLRCWCLLLFRGCCGYVFDQHVYTRTQPTQQNQFCVFEIFVLVELNRVVQVLNVLTMLIEEVVLLVSICSHHMSSRRLARVLCYCTRGTEPLEHQFVVHTGSCATCRAGWWGQPRAWDWALGAGGRGALQWELPGVLHRPRRNGRRGEELPLLGH